MFQNFVIDYEAKSNNVSWLLVTNLENWSSMSVPLIFKLSLGIVNNSRDDNEPWYPFFCMFSLASHLLSHLFSPPTFSCTFSYCSGCSFFYLLNILKMFSPRHFCIWTKGNCYRNFITFPSCQMVSSSWTSLEFEATPSSFNHSSNLMGISKLEFERIRVP